MLLDLQFLEQKLKKLIPNPENVAFRNTLVEKPSAFLETKTSKKERKRSFSVSMVKLMLLCCRFK